MSNNKAVPDTAHRTFEGIRQIDADGNEFWSARQLSKVLDYSEYRHFLPVVERAREACQNSGHPSADHFEEVLEMPENLPTPETSIKQLEWKTQQLEDKKGRKK